MPIKYYSIPDPSNKIEVSILAQFNRLSEKNGVIFTFKPIYENQDTINVWFPCPTEDQAEWHKSLQEGDVYRLKVRFVSSGISAKIIKKEILSVEPTDLSWGDASWHSGVTLDIHQLIPHNTSWSERRVSELRTSDGKAFIRTSIDNHAASILSNSVCIYLDYDMRDYMWSKDRYDIRQAWDEENNRTSFQSSLVWKL